MELKNLFIREKQEYKKLEKLLNEIFIIEQEFPKKVFRERYRNYLFQQFDLAMSDQFWPVIQELARKNDDAFIYLAVLKPHPLNYYYEEFNYFNCVKLPTNLSSDEYFEVLEIGPDGWPADAILYNSYTVVWVSPSMKWAIWGDREYEVCVIAFREDIDLTDLLPTLNNWRLADDVVMSWISLIFKNQKLPKRLANTIYLNYSKDTKRNKWYEKIKKFWGQRF